jgi:hypothetical protein
MKSFNMYQVYHNLQNYFEHYSCSLGWIVGLLKAILNAKATIVKLRKSLDISFFNQFFIIFWLENYLF